MASKSSRWPCRPWWPRARAPSTWTASTRWPTTSARVWWCSGSCATCSSTSGSPANNRRTTDPSKVNHRTSLRPKKERPATNQRRRIRHPDWPAAAAHLAPPIVVCIESDDDAVAGRLHHIRSTGPDVPRHRRPEPAPPGAAHPAADARPGRRLPLQSGQFRGRGHGHRLHDGLRSVPLPQTHSLT